MDITCFKQYNVLVTDGESIFYQGDFLNREEAEKTLAMKLQLFCRPSVYGRIEERYRLSRPNVL